VEYQRNGAVVHAAWWSPIFEALPERFVRRRTISAWAEEPPGDDEDLANDSQQTYELPRALVGVRVLVVDDDEGTAELFAAALTACGADVLTAASATDALRVFAARVPDVVVTDIAMPGADGYWLMREIRQLPDVPGRTVPVVAVTAFGREHFRSRSLASGFFDHLEKPVDPLVLCETVARASSR
jgi:CheY-like chemotaxis protein